MSDSTKPNLAAVPDPEVPSTARRRRFTAAYKLQILRELDAVTESGQAGAILRREGLYSSHVSQWRKKRAAGELQGLSSRRQGRPPKPRNPLSAEVERLERDNAQLAEALRKTRLIIEVQKKVSEMLDLPPSNGSSE